MDVSTSKEINLNELKEKYKYYEFDDKDLLIKYHDHLINKISDENKEVLNDFIDHMNFAYLHQKIYYKSVLLGDLVLLKDLELKNLEHEKMKIKINKQKTEIELKNLEINILKKLINKKEFNKKNNKKRKMLESMNKEINTFPRKIRMISRNFNSKILLGSKKLKTIALDLKND